MKAVAAFIATLCLLLAGCGKEGEPVDVAFENAIAAIEARNIEQLETFLDQNFSSDVNHQDLMYGAASWFSSKPTIKINVLEHQTTLHSSGATIRATLNVSSSTQMFKTRSRRFHLDTEWVNTHAGWKVRVAQWRPA